MGKKKSRVIPDFLQGTWPAPELKHLMKNWLVLHRHISKLDNSIKSLCVLRSLLVNEYFRMEGPRMDIVVRLYGKFNAMRVELERTQL